MRLGSGDTAALLAGKNTKTHQALLERFVTGIKPYYNAFNSPIDALRTGAILEDRYFEVLPQDFFPQYEVVCEEMNVFTAHIDFAQLKEGKIIDFQELKTCALDSYLKIQSLANNESELLSYVKKYYKNNYNQVQQQLLCSGLESASIVYLGVTTYDDEENYNRVIKGHEFTDVRIFRDEDVIAKIKERGQIFQQIKDYYERK